MNKDLADITLIVDRSGSMESCRSDAEGGINAFIAEQKRLPGMALLTLVEFDHEYAFVHKAKPIAEVSGYKLSPRGCTALYDALGRAINETGKRLDEMSEGSRPGLVVFCIVTDGQENSSKEFKKAQIKEMIERQQSKYSWQFTYLAANQDAFAEAGGIGFTQASVANFTVDNAAVAYASASANIGRMRKNAGVGACANSSYTSEERKNMTKGVTK